MDHFDYYYNDVLDGLSDADGPSSSDDEENSCQQLARFSKHLSQQDRAVLFGDADEDDSNISFEREMEKEASSHINGFHVTHSSNDDKTPCLPEPPCSTTQQQIHDELFYDPEADDRDQQWVDSKRPHYFSQGDSTTDLTPSKDLKDKKLKEDSRLRKPKSDASLNCPCCLALLCLDCQQHDIYKTQYRAMFVLNCRVDFGQQLVHRDKQERRQQYRRSKSARQSQTNAGEEQRTSQVSTSKDLFYPVHCQTCNTQVAVYDTEEVYHFFSVLASH